MDKKNFVVAGAHYLVVDKKNFVVDKKNFVAAGVGHGRIRTRELEIKLTSSSKLGENNNDISTTSRNKILERYA